ncbi:hypothetical protein CIL05_19880 [Virgibacillus profundi]|uniref:Uncharacterized protein n=1 Tax=Virgibacillus profundi TaxID=2024555 RepID=A0A2A2I724_9BACI|nr:hypothetical protein [Virgibacillus profundi]PAV27811.1 hypothetical protein CIL05_19880 [Virgibacillus profundi]PXY51938.1 hypothetical protein CIT14_20245 [Virgibacillus profundi]
MLKNKIILFLCKLLSYSPILRITDDLQFGKIENNSLERLRISFLSFNFGKRIIHFFTYYIETKEMNFLNIINLEKLCNYPNDKADKAYDSYKKEIETVNDDKVLIHKETLMYKISQIEGTKNKTFNKYVAYIAIIALILPLYGAQLSKLHNFIGDYKVLFLIALVYILINLLLFFHDFMRVRGYNRTRFNSIRKSDTPLKEFTESLYYEWLTIKSESTFQVTLIKNIEKYMIGFVIISVLLLTSHTAEQHIAKVDNSIVLNNSISSPTTLIHLSEVQSDGGDFMKINDLELTSLKDRLLYNNIDKLIILYNEETSSLVDLSKFLDMYNDGFTDIIELRDTNTQMISIIVIEED